MNFPSLIDKLCAAGVRDGDVTVVHDSIMVDVPAHQAALVSEIIARHYEDEACAQLELWQYFYAPTEKDNINEK